MQRCGKLYRIAMPEHMHVHRERLVPQQVIVQRRHLDAARREFVITALTSLSVSTRSPITMPPLPIFSKAS